MYGIKFVGPLKRRVVNSPSKYMTFSHLKHYDRKSKIVKEILFLSQSDFELKEWHFTLIIAGVMMTSDHTSYDFWPHDSDMVDHEVMYRLRKINVEEKETTLRSINKTISRVCLYFCLDFKFFRLITLSNKP